jgi:hypothetical protein
MTKIRDKTGEAVVDRRGQGKTPTLGVGRAKEWEPKSTRALPQTGQSAARSARIGASVGRVLPPAKGTPGPKSIPRPKPPVTNKKGQR